MLGISAHTLKLKASCNKAHSSSSYKRGFFPKRPSDIRKLMILQFNVSSRKKCESNKKKKKEMKKVFKSTKLLSRLKLKLTPRIFVSRLGWDPIQLNHS